MVRRRAPRRRRLALSGAAPYGRSRLDSRRVDRQRHRPARPHLRSDGGRQEAAWRRGIALASRHRGGQSGSDDGLNMSLWSRIVNAVRADRLSREIDEEAQSHIAEAVAHGRDPAEARHAFGSALRYGEQSRDLRLVAWLDSLRADAAFGWRQLMKNKVASAAAILSLALGIGACTGAFRLIDALLLRPLPVDHPEQLYALARTGVDPEGKFGIFDGWAYPDFVLMRAAAKDQAELIAISYSE